MLELIIFLGSVSIVVFLSVFITLWILVAGASKSKEELELPPEQQQKASKARLVAIIGASTLAAVVGMIFAVVGQIFLYIFTGSTDA